ncbi:hypothetical protein [Parasphaerochaeta coccoides]|uniref:Uncharacterized protein n=1 Tax=Parasphaerochaeta coccoides (strain ATCC BAA-1237 / DSM 17374 / SPN1) TaxID=760011 RepID=F4GL42_PARC1|nr:hypothetical protein [Parasphaerochaeta coccoides]AEC02382.1 hypothetical protein Spico_1168 [Parasphaerochaeta coccoides DSM 17374]
MMLALAIAGGILGLGKGIASSIARNAEYKAKLEELNRSKESLDKQYSQAQSSLNLQKTQAQAQTSEANTELNLLAIQTEQNRAVALGQASRAGSLASQIASSQVATLAVENQKTEGTALQQVATSGFRNSGTAGNVLENAQRSSDDSLALARQQIGLSHVQTYSSALNAYTSATEQTEAYRRQVDANNSNLARVQEEIDLSLSQAKEMYDMNAGNLQEDIDYMKTTGRITTGWAMAGDIFGGLYEGARSMVNTNTGKWLWE